MAHVATTTTELLPEHVRDLQQSGLTPETIKAASLYSVTGEDAGKLLGFRPAKMQTGLAFPYGKGFVRIKVFPAYRDRDGHKVKYLQPKGSGVRIYIPPSALPRLADRSATLYIFEGEKKALRGAQDGLCCIGLAGIWNWKEGSRLAKELRELKLSGRRISIVPDSDVQDNSHVRRAVLALWDALKDRGANVRIVLLPRGAGRHSKTGADDYLARHTLREFLHLPSVRRRSDLPKPPPINRGGGGESRLVSFGKLPEPPRVKPLMGGLLARNHSTTLYGDGGQGKSLIAMAIGLAMTRGRHFLGHRLSKRRVLYLDWELSQDEQLRRAFEISRGMGYQKPSKRFFYMNPNEPLPELVPALRSLVRRRKINVLIVDSAGPSFGVSPEAAEEIMRVFAEIRSLGMTVLIVDHQSKLQEGQHSSKKTPFGSVYKTNLSRSVVHLERVRSKKNVIKVLLRHTKNNFGGNHDDIALRIKFNKAKGAISFKATSVENDPDFHGRLQAADQIVMALKKYGPAEVKTLSELTPLKVKTISNRLAKLERAGRVEVVKKNGKRQVWGLVNGAEGGAK